MNWWLLIRCRNFSSPTLCCFFRADELGTAVSWCVLCDAVVPKVRRLGAVDNLCGYLAVITGENRAVVRAAPGRVMWPDVAARILAVWAARVCQYVIQSRI